MKPGKRVSYVDRNGRSRPATVTAVVGTGDSGYKVVDLRYDTKTRTKELEAVVHRRDDEGKGYWKSITQ